MAAESMFSVDMFYWQMWKSVVHELGEVPEAKDASYVVWLCLDSLAPGQPGSTNTSLLGATWRVVARI